jgi:IucA / IucC family
MKISSALRTISHFTAYSGPRLGRDVIPHLAIDPKVLIIENEIASVVYRHNDPEVAKHCTAIIRETYNGEEQGEAVVVAAALAEIAYGDREDEVPVVVTSLGLDTSDKKLAFLERYVLCIYTSHPNAKRTN